MKYFLADPHYGHTTFFRENIPQEKRVRPFTSAEACDGTTIEGINSKVTKSDTLYLLGDIAWDNKLEEFRKKIRCNDIWVVAGNHDNKNKLKKVFGEKRVFDALERKVFNTPVYLHHYMCFVWPKSHRGSYHLFGHVHDQRSLWIEEHYPEMKALDVCPDAHHRVFGGWEPWSEEEVESILSQKRGHDNLDYYHEYQRLHLHYQEPIR